LDDASRSEHGFSASFARAALFSVSTKLFDNLSGTLKRNAERASRMAIWNASRRIGRIALSGPVAFVSPAGRPHIEKRRCSGEKSIGASVAARLHKSLKPFPAKI
jgi:hypothetical protein